MEGKVDFILKKGNLKQMTRIKNLQIETGKRKDVLDDLIKTKKKINMNILKRILLNNKAVTILENEVKKIKLDDNQKALEFINNISNAVDEKGIKYEELEDALVLSQIKKTSEEIQNTKNKIMFVLKIALSLGFSGGVITFLATLVYILDQILKSK